MSSAFLRFCCQFRKKIIFYQPVNTDKLKFVAFLVFVCTTVPFIAQISSSENFSKGDAILASVAKQWIVWVYATGRQEEEKGETLVRDERGRAITCVFCRGLHYDRLFLVFYKKTWLKESDFLRKVISSKIIVTRVTQVLPSSFLSRPVA